MLAIEKGKWAWNTDDSHAGGNIDKIDGVYCCGSIVTVLIGGASFYLNHQNTKSALETARTLTRTSMRLAHEP